MSNLLGDFPAQGEIPKLTTPNYGGLQNTRNFWMYILHSVCQATTAEEDKAQPAADNSAQATDR